MLRAGSLYNTALQNSLKRNLGAKIGLNHEFSRTIKARALQTFGKAEFDYKWLIENYAELKKTIELKHLNNGTLIKELNYIRDHYPILAELGRELGSLKAQRDEIRVDSGTAMSESTKVMLREHKKKIQKIQKEREAIQDRCHQFAERFPTVIHESVGKEEEIVELINCTSVEDIESNADKKAPSHKEIGQNLGILELDAAARTSGHAFYYLLGDGAYLEQALIQYALAKARARGYKMVAPPTITRSEVIKACGFRPRDKGKETQIYNLEKEDMCLTGTAEITLAALQSKKVLDQKIEESPLKYVGVARSYRAEAGARGVKTAGLFRVHEFNKVELFHFTSPETAWEQLEDLKDFQVEMIKELGLKAKVLNMPASDLGFPAAKKYDIEVWMPGRINWGEVTSTSYCRDYQARRMNIKYKDSKKNSLAFVHTLNGTAMAVPRVIVAILENFWDPKTESVVIPEVLRPYMGGMERIYKQ